LCGHGCMVSSLLVSVGGAVVCAGGLSSGSCDSSANWFDEVKGGRKSLGVFSLGGVVAPSF